MTEDKLNILPVVTGVAVVIAVIAIAFSVVALGRSGDAGSAAPAAESTAGMSGMGHEGGGAAHMAPLSIEGIKDAPADRGGTALRGMRRNGVLEFELDARPVWWRIYGSQRLAAWAYNGTVPGPVIRVRNGERVRVRFANRLPEETTVHWHGIGVPNRSDGVPGVTQKAIPPGRSYTYEFTARPAGDPGGSGTFLYHSHVDEDRQMSAGLYGALIIDPPSGRPAAAPTERTLVFSEWTAEAATGRTRGVMQMDGMWPNFFTINGRSWPDTERVKVEAGQRVLLRLVNAGQFEHPIHLHGTSFDVVARDGHPAPASGRRDAITLASGERADIAFTLPKGKWALHCHIGHHLTNDGEGPGGLMMLVEAT